MKKLWEATDPYLARTVDFFLKYQNKKKNLQITRSIIYLSKANIRNTKTSGEIYPKLTKDTRTASINAILVSLLLTHFKYCSSAFAIGLEKLTV